MSLKIDGVLSPRQAADLEGHLRACPRCRATWASLQQLDAMIAHPAWSEPAADLTVRVLERLPARRRDAVVPAVRPVWTRAGMVVLAAVAVLLVAVAGAVVALGLGPAPGEWAPWVQGGRGVIAAAGKSVGHLVEVMEVAVGALWQALRWPWLALLGGGAVLAAGLLWSWWRWSRPVARGH